MWCSNANSVDGCVRSPCHHSCRRRPVWRLWLVRQSEDPWGLPAPWINQETRPQNIWGPISQHLTRPRVSVWQPSAHPVLAKLFWGHPSRRIRWVWNHQGWRWSQNQVRTESDYHGEYGLCGWSTRTTNTKSRISSLFHSKSIAAVLSQSPTNVRIQVD